jgi:phage terminase Nu1 subunit (DNA packaging protein)
MAHEKEQTVSAGELADLLATTEKTLSAWAKSGVVTRVSHGKSALLPSIRGFARHVKSRAGGGEAAVAAVASERGSLLRVQRQRAELELAREEGKLLKLADVAAHWSAILRTLRSACLAIPTRVASRVSGLSREAVYEIDQEIRLALTEMATAGYPLPGSEGEAAKNGEAA